MSKNKKYESPILNFTTLRTFEVIAAGGGNTGDNSQCWANPNKYTIKDPSCGEAFKINVDVTQTGNGCQQKTIDAIYKYLEDITCSAGDKFTKEEIKSVFTYGGSNNGQNVKTDGNPNIWS